MNIEEEVYRALVERIGDLRFQTSGGEHYGLMLGALEALRTLGYEIHAGLFHKDLSRYENALYDKQEEARLRAEAEDDDLD
jgi:hypothetical protein